MSGFGGPRHGLADPSLVSPQVGYLPPKSLHLSPSEVAAAAGIDEAEVARLDANENPLGPSPHAIDAMRASLGELHRYPDPDATGLRRALARHHGVSEEQVVVGNGSSELMDLLVRTFVGPGQTVMTSWPSYPTYRLAAMVNGRELLTAPLRRGKIDLGALATLGDARCKLVFIANPNNPTGTYVGVRELNAFLNRVPPEVIVVLDEAYADFAHAEDYPKAMSMIRHPRVVVLRTFSKLYGLAGVRVGYGVMAPTLVQHLDLMRPSHDVNAVGLVAARAALEDEDHIERSLRLVLRERARLVEGLARLGLHPHPSETNFLCLAGMPWGTAARLAERGVLVRDLAAHDMPDAIRVSVGAPDANARFLAALPEALAASTP